MHAWRPSLSPYFSSPPPVAQGNSSGSVAAPWREFWEVLGQLHQILNILKRLYLIFSVPLPPNPLKAQAPPQKKNSNKIVRFVGFVSFNSYQLRQRVRQADHHLLSLRQLRSQSLVDSKRPRPRWESCGFHKVKLVHLRCATFSGLIQSNSSIF